MTDKIKEKMIPVKSARLVHPINIPGTNILDYTVNPTKHTDVSSLFFCSLGLLIITKKDQEVLVPPSNVDFVML